MRQGSKRHAAQALPGVAIPGLASFFGMVAVQKVAGPHTLGLLSLAWITAVFGSAVIAYGPAQVALRAVATEQPELVGLHRWLLVRRAAAVGPAVLALGVALTLAGRSAGLPLVLGAVWMVAHSFVLFETEVLRARRRFRAASALLVCRAVAGWALTVGGAAVSSSVVAAAAPQILFTALLVLALRPAIAWGASGDDLAAARALGQPIGRLAVASYALGYGDRYVLDLILGPVAVGVYTLAYQLGEGALELFSAPVASALLPRVVSEWNSGDRATAWRTVQRGQAAVIGVSIASLPVIFVADRVGLFRLISPNRHFPAIVGIIAIAVGIQGTTKLSYGLLLAQGRPAVANRCFWQVVIVSALAVPVMTHAFGILGTAMATLLGYSVLATLMHRAAKSG